MYAWLSIDFTQGDPAACVHPCTLNTINPPESDLAKLQERRRTVMQVITAITPKPTPDESNRLFKVLSEVAASLPANHANFEFAVYMGMAHHRLPPAQRAAREQRIDAIIEAYHGPLDTRSALLQSRLSLIRIQAVLLPDALLQSHVSTACTFLLSPAVLSINPTLATPEVLKDGAALSELAASVSRSREEAERSYTALRMAYISAPRDQRRSLLEFLNAPANRPVVAMAGAMHATLLKQVEMCPLVLRVQTWMDVLRECATTNPGGPGCPTADDILQTHVMDLRAQQDRMYNLIRLESVAALEAGVPMGSKGVITRDVMLNMRFTEFELNARLLPRDLSAKAAPSPTGTTDMAPVQAWSVSRLLRWIEGPLAERPARGRLDRQAVMAREKGMVDRANIEARQSSKIRGPRVPVITESDVDTVMNDGLAATARFFHDDINEMAPLAKALGAAAALLERCNELREPLQSMSDKPAAFDEEKARVLLQDAEARIKELRKGIKLAEASAQLARRFSTQLAVALKAETLVLGKRHGGVIACPLQPADWAWVAQMFHRRWLPQITRLVIDGQVITLQADQAVALYVTGSSQSSFAFDVSVHLWQRRADRTSPPSELMDACPPMNEADWFDTYVPCAVLHVPPVH